MTKILPEENGIYGIDCTKAVWATNEIQRHYHDAKLHLLKNVDFIIETEDELLITEYKNSTLEGAVNPSSFHPMDDKRINSIALKFYGSLPYLTLMKKDKPKRYIYIVEAEHSDSTMRARLRNRIMKELPFQLQADMDTGVRLIEDLDVLSMDEWDHHSLYSNFPFVRLQEEKDECDRGGTGEEDDGNF